MQTRPAATSHQWLCHFMFVLMVSSPQLTQIGMGQATDAVRFRFSQPHLGTLVRFTVYAPNSAIANRAATEAYAEIQRLDAVFSSYRNDSELVRLHASHRNQKNAVNEPIAINHDLWFVLQQSLYFSRETAGAFDVTVGPYARIWKRAIRRSSMPEPAALAKVAGSVGYDSIRISPAKPLDGDEPHGHQCRTIAFQAPNMRLDFSAIAKGYIADRALRVFRKQGLPCVLVDAGGDLAIGAPPPGKSGWQVSIQADDHQNAKANATRTIVVHHCGVATSGDTYQRLTADGKRYSHIIDPRTGDSVTHGLAVTIVAKDAMTADALASAASVIGRDESELSGGHDVAGMLHKLSAAGLFHPSSVTESDGDFAKFVDRVQELQPKWLKGESKAHRESMD